MFAQPTSGAVDLRPIGAHVILTIGQVARIVSEQEPFATMGYSPEGQAAIWIPVGRVRADGERAQAEELLMFTPYMWVDNPISLASGREMYGFAKAFGWMTLPAGGEEESFGLDVFGMDYGRDEPPSRRTLVSITRGERVHELTDVAWSALRDVGRHMRGLIEGQQGGAVRYGTRFMESLVRDVSAGGVRQVFLRQMRAVDDATRAALAQVTEVPYRVSSLRGAPLEHEYAVDIAALDSHPLGTELGLCSQLTRYAYRTESQFVLGRGSVLWTLPRRQRAPTREASSRRPLPTPAGREAGRSGSPLACASPRARSRSPGAARSHRRSAPPCTAAGRRPPTARRAPRASPPGSARRRS